MTNGQIAFEAYNKSRGGLNFQGNKTPDWFDLPVEIRAAWEIAAGAVLSAQNRKISVENCSACGSNHYQMKFNKLSRSFEERDQIWEWWGKCPNTGDPVFAADLPSVETGGEQ